MIRITTNSTLFTYQSNLMQSTNQLYSAMSKLMTQRNFNAFSADPPPGLSKSTAPSMPPGSRPPTTRRWSTS